MVIEYPVAAVHDWSDCHYWRIVFQSPREESLENGVCSVTTNLRKRDRRAKSSTRQRSAESVVTDRFHLTVTFQINNTEKTCPCLFALFARLTAREYPRHHIISVCQAFAWRIQRFGSYRVSWTISKNVRLTRYSHNDVNVWFGHITHYNIVRTIITDSGCGNTLDNSLDGTQHSCK